MLVRELESKTRKNAYKPMPPTTTDLLSTDQFLRLECLKLAVASATRGDINAPSMRAIGYYEWVSSGIDPIASD